MSGVNVEAILIEVEALLSRAGDLPDEAQQAVEKLLNVVEALSADKNELADEVQKLRKQLEQKKKAKTTAEGKQDGDQSPSQDTHHSSEKRRRKRDRKRRPQRDRRSLVRHADVLRQNTRLRIQDLPKRRIVSGGDLRRRQLGIESIENIIDVVVKYRPEAAIGCRIRIGANLCQRW